MKGKKARTLVYISLTAILLGALFYFSVLEDLLSVKDTSAGTSLLATNRPVYYSNEFCASRLTDLIHEYHFLESDIRKEEELLGGEEILSANESEVIKIEQRELKIIEKEFFRYKSLCDSFEENPTPELCSMFLEETSTILERAKQNAENAMDTVSWIKYALKDLQKAQRMYNGIKAICG
jgi:hypothetical protein